MADGDGKASLEELVGRVFATRDASHLAHWKTKSFAKHMALGDLYDALPDEIDGIVEAYQGAKGLIKTGADESSLIRHLEQEAAWIAKNREGIANGVPSVLNMIDGLHARYVTALYKLKNLD